MALSDFNAAGIIGTYQRVVQEAAADWVDQIALRIPSNSASETLKWLGSNPTFRAWEGERLVKGLRDGGVTITNETFEASLGIDVDIVRRDQTGQIEPQIMNLGRRSVAHLKSKLTDLLTDGTTDLCYDGLAFFSASHSEGDSGTQSNLLTASDYASLNVGTAVQPTAAEMEAAIFDVIAHSMSYLDDNAEPMTDGADSFVVMTPVNSIWRAAVSAITSDVVNNNTNSLKNSGMNLAVVANGKLSRTSADFYVFNVGGFNKPMLYTQDLDPEVTVLGPESEHAVKTNQILVAAKACRGFGYGFWQGAVKATLS